MAGFRSCQMGIYREHADKAIAELQKHAARLVEGSIRFDGERLHFKIDHAAVPEGAAPAIELVLIRAVENAVRS